MIEVLYHDVTAPCGQPADVMLSALQKFIRRGKTEDAARAAYELYLCGEELREYAWSRLLVISAEDIGQGSPAAPVVVQALMEAAARIGADAPDYPVFLVQAVRYLCSCRKERGASILSSVIKRRIRDKEPFLIPDYVFDMHTIAGQQMGREYAHFANEAAKVAPQMLQSAEDFASGMRLEEELKRRREEANE